MCKGVDMMRLERRWFAFLVVVALIFVGQVYVPASQAIACEQGEVPGEENPGQVDPGQEDSCQDLDNKTVFYVLKEEHQIPSALELGSQLTYYNGIVFDQVYEGLGNTQYYGDPAVFLDGKDISEYFDADFQVPTIEQLKAVGVVMNEGDKIIWYSLKREQNTWHVDGIKITCTEPPTTPSVTPSQENTNPAPVVPEVAASPSPTVMPVIEEPATVEPVVVEPVIEKPEPQDPVEEEPVVEEVEDTQTEDVVDDPAPEALPQTGTINPISFYFMGGVLIIAGVYVVASRKKSEYVIEKN